jgi:hypothetical protein
MQPSDALVADPVRLASDLVGSVVGEIRSVVLLFVSCVGCRIGGLVGGIRAFVGRFVSRLFCSVIFWGIHSFTSWELVGKVEGDALSNMLVRLSRAPGRPEHSADRVAVFAVKTVLGLLGEFYV